MESKMLTIRRIPTIVSNYQESLESKIGCGKNCLGSCCIPGARLPLYLFGNQELDEHGEIQSKELGQNSFLDSAILGQWADKQAEGLFRYDVTACDTKVLPGKYGFIAQLNEGRHLKKRPTEFRVDQVLQPFDHKKFNFTKVGQEEMLFCFEQSNNDKSYYHSKAYIRGSPNVVVINVSPIEYGHILLVPRVLDCIPQHLETDTFLLAIYMAAEASSPFFRLGYNSLGAFATINHLHFQAYYLGNCFPVEKAPTKLILHHYKGFKVYQLENYPVKGIVYEVGESNFEELAFYIIKVCKGLQGRNIPYNILIANKGCQIFLFPQCYAEKQARGEVDLEILETQVNPAVWEISGHIVLKRKEDFERATEEYAWRLLAEVSVSEKVFDEIIKLVFSSAEDKFDAKLYHKSLISTDITYYTVGENVIMV
ncbi:GDP-L-galactose phosphorylase 1 [Selaginella moellendorffii]|nr:GDP-L-galactose phosphorylase 1 [Selaginella moellendorffii]|eukprot:XP_002976520.2 GDP-L-galactose phosphorylase 1 [Selaginella moellendorffii]